MISPLANGGGVSDGDLMQVSDPPDPDDTDDDVPAHEPEAADGERWEPL
ncbi:hypothetical protein [Jiangella alba]|uniref:Uncharacterized protein n=1 Tax=Jiangella alba TaxID=561176 RepID=A0A1H5PUW2_9ACTN|nr:hypothetical protein [Jiangella alba]SEF17424.1 hypothetical protein SAMN04488561_5862 [Jiangella alba]